MDLNTIVYHSWIWTWLEAIPAGDKIAVWVSASAKRLVSIRLTEDVIVPALWYIWINKKAKEFGYLVFAYNTKPRWTALTRSLGISQFELVISCCCCNYLTIIPRARMGSESIAHEAEGRKCYWLRGHEGERNNCLSKIQLVGQKYRE